MRHLRLAVTLAGALAVAAPLALLTGDQPSRAADHVEPPTRTDPTVDPIPDAPADMADIYFWHTDQHVIFALTFGGPSDPSLPAYYDRDVLYKINVSNAGLRTDAEFPIEIRFGHNGAATGVQLKNVPGAPGVIEGPVETDIVSGGVTVRAGLFDDPFFFDSQGLRETRQSGTLSMRADRSFFHAKNITVVVIQVPRSALENGTSPIDVWTQTLRFGGQI